jgi:hypothetical protein
VLLAGLLLLAFAGSASAAQTEQILDSGFEATKCPTPDALDCTNAAWTEGPLSYACRMPPCGPGPASGSGFWTFGPTSSGPGNKYAITHQPVEIPEAPATMTFEVEIQLSSQTSTGGIRVEFDHKDTSFEKEGTELPASYAPQTIDVSEFAGPGVKDLEFVYFCKEGPFNTQCPIINLDNVSLKTGTPDPLPLPLAPTPLPSTGPSVTPKAIKCRKGFRKKTVKGKPRCVKKRKKGKRRG